MVKKCDPDKFICTLDQYFVEKNIVEGVLEKKGVVAALDAMKPLFNERLENEIIRAEYLRDKRTQPFSIEDIDRLREEIQHWETTQRNARGIYSDTFINQQLTNKRQIYHDLLFAEKEAFKSAINKRDTHQVYIAVLRRLPGDMPYDLTDKSDVVERVINGQTLDEIIKAHPEMPKANIHKIAEIIERGKH